MAWETLVMPDSRELLPGWAGHSTRVVTKNIRD